MLSWSPLVSVDYQILKMSFTILHQCAVHMDEGLDYSQNWFPFCHEKIETQKLGAGDFVKKI